MYLIKPLQEFRRANDCNCKFPIFMMMKKIKPLAMSNSNDSFLLQLLQKQSLDPQIIQKLIDNGPNVSKRNIKRWDNDVFSPFYLYHNHRISY